MSKDDIYTQLGKQITELLAKQWAGQIIYFPRSTELKLTARDLEIYARFNGLNHTDLADEYGVSLQHVYRIIKTVHHTQPPIDICEALITAATRSNDKCVFSPDMPVFGASFKKSTKPRYFTREVTFLACAHCGTEQPAEYDGVLARHCVSCSVEITHNELCPHCHTHGTDDELALFATFKGCPICGGALNQPAA